MTVFCNYLRSYWRLFRRYFRIFKGLFRIFCRHNDDYLSLHWHFTSTYLWYFDVIYKYISGCYGYIYAHHGVIYPLRCNNLSASLAKQAQYYRQIVIDHKLLCATYRYLLLSKSLSWLFTTSHLSFCFPFAFCISHLLFAFSILVVDVWFIL